MPRRNDTSFFGLLLLMPWWLTLIAGLGIWVWRRTHPLPAAPLDPVALFHSMGLAALQVFCLIASAASATAMLMRGIVFAKAKDIEAIRNMSWRQFETLVGEAYRRQGYDVDETGGGGADGGVDLILRGNGRKVLVQCKQWRAWKVGVRVVREMVGVMAHEKADSVIIVSSGTFTGEARAFARGKHVELVDGRELVALISTVKARPAADALTTMKRFIRQQQELRNSRKATEPPPLPCDSKPAASAATNDLAVSVPVCPQCGAAMVMRTARQGLHAGNRFWGCSRYPECRGIVQASQ